MAPRSRHRLILLAVWAAAVAAGVAWLGVVTSGSSIGQADSGRTPNAVDVTVKLSPKEDRGRLERPLATLVGALEAYGAAGLQAIAPSLGVSLDGGAVRVIVEAQPGEADQVSALAEAADVRVEAVSGDLVQVLAPVRALRALGEGPGVQRVRLPLRWVAADQVTGKGVRVIGATEWHGAGFTGSDTRAAVLDVGFEGYEALLRTELPQSVVTQSCRADGDITGGGEAHGTAVAEIVHEVAPGAQLFLANFNTEVELAECVDWLVEQGVQVVNFSIGFVGSGPGDGTGLVNEIVDGALDAGVVWVNAAGNEAQAHWSGPWADADDDDALNFMGIDETNHIDARADEVIEVLVKWDDAFGASCNDYDLYLLDPSAENIVAASEGVQDFCTSAQPADPVEFIIYPVPVTGRYHVIIVAFSADGLADFHLYSLGHSCPILEYCVEAGSVIEPADNARVLAVGAVGWNEPETVQDYSSRGPTDDGRVKPDLVAPDGVSSVTAGAFFGTSASSPHGAGAAALVRQWQPDWTADEIRSFLVSRAVDLGEPGADNTTGAGRLFLGMPKPTPTPTPTATPTATETPTPTPTPARVPGDVNCDRTVTSLDAALILQREARLLASLACPENADVNGDGAVNSIDAVLILSLVGGLIDRL